MIRYIVAMTYFDKKNCLGLQKLTVFDLNGHILLDGNGVENGFMHLSGYKFEGLEFL